MREADTNYFSTMGIRLIKGRFFSDHDSTDSQAVALVDEKFAQRFWAHDDPVGKHLWFDPKKPIEIAGVVGNVKQYGLDSDSKIAVYFAHAQQAGGGMYLTARTAIEPEQMANAIVAQIHKVDPNVVVYDIRTMQERLHASLARQRFASTLLASFAVFAILLAAIGVYGVISYLVTQNTHEIGIRVALGAGAGRVMAMVVKQGLGLVGTGILTGLIGAVAFTRVMASLLFGVTALDGLTFASVVLILTVVALAATIIPASRVTRVDPAVALRQD
jgi:putative ABC transport system permease protein